MRWDAAVAAAFLGIVRAGFCDVVLLFAAFASSFGSVCKIVSHIVESAAHWRTFFTRRFTHTWSTGVAGASALEFDDFAKRLNMF